MSRKIIADENSWNRISLRRDGHDDDQIVLVGSGRNAYLRINRGDHHRVEISGPATLRKFAKAILKEVGDDA